jgi:SNF2 family DNA or RNA helicase
VLNAQAEDRIHRIGQTAGSVNIIDVVTEGTIESAVADTLKKKGEMLEEFVQDAVTLKEWLS